ELRARLPRRGGNRRVRAGATISQSPAGLDFRRLYGSLLVWLLPRVGKRLAPEAVPLTQLIEDDGDAGQRPVGYRPSDRLVGHRAPRRFEAGNRADPRRHRLAQGELHPLRADWTDDRGQRAADDHPQPLFQSPLSAAPAESLPALWPS